MPKLNLADVKPSTLTNNFMVSQDAEAGERLRQQSQIVRL